MKLVEELKNEHIFILDLLKTIKDIGYFTDEGRKKLLSAKENFLSHLKKENEKFYPLLKKAAKNDESLYRLLNIFAKDMDKIYDSVLDFFDKYMKNSEEERNFPKDLGRFIFVINRRIEKEENILFKEFEKICAKMKKKGV